MDHGHICRRVRLALLRCCGGVLIGLLVGCAGETSYRLGKEEMAAGNYSEAAVLLRRAVAESPGNQTYLRTLDQAELLAAERHFARAREYWQMNRAWMAREALQEVFANVPAHPQAMLLQESVEQRIARVEHLTAQAREQIASGHRKPAESLAKQAYELDPSHPDAHALAVEMAIIDASAPPGVEEDTEALVAGPETSESAPVPSPAAPTVRKAPAPRDQIPEKRTRLEAPRRIARVVLSRNDKRYRKKELITDGIEIKVKDTDARPLDADLEIRVGRRKFKHKDQRVGAQIPVTGVSGKRYTVMIIAIVDRHETVVLDLLTRDQ